MCIGFVKSYAGALGGTILPWPAEGGLLGGNDYLPRNVLRRHQLLYRIGLSIVQHLLVSIRWASSTGLAEIKSGGYNGWVRCYFPLSIIANALFSPFHLLRRGGITITLGILTIFFLPHTT